MLTTLFIIVQVLFPVYVTAAPIQGDELKNLNNSTQWVADSCAVSGSGGASATQGATDITSIVNRYQLQSVMITKVNGGVVAQSNANTPPATPASTMKLIIADTVLRSGLDLGKTVAVTSDVYYNGGNDLHKSHVTLGEALQAMLSVSSNVGANVLMKAMGGVGAFTQKAQGYGYTHTTVNGYYDPSNDGKNTSTISDEVNAMAHIFSTQGPNYVKAQSYLKSAAQNDNFYNVNGVIANKWAGTSTVAGNVGLFHINNDDYVVGLYYNGSDSSPEAVNAMRNGSSDLVDVISGAASGTTLPNAPSACCSGGSVSFSGGVLPSYIKQPYNEIFTKAGQKYNVDPAVLVGIFYDENFGYQNAVSAFKQHQNREPPPPYGHGAPWPVSSAQAQGPFQFIPSTYQSYAVDGNGDGKTDPNDLTDESFSAAKYLADLGLTGSVSESDFVSAGNSYSGGYAGYGEAAWQIYKQIKLDENGGSVGGGGGSVGGCGGAAVDCTSVTGDAKILCAAKAYEGIYYEFGGGHQGYAAFKQGCPDPSNPSNNQPHGGPVNGDPAGLSGNPSPCGLDCSSLVSVAVDDAFKQSYMWSVSGSMQGAGAQFWHSIPSSQAKAGDIVTTSDHVEIVDHVSGGTVYTFGAHNTGVKIGPTSAPLGYYTGGAWRWTGPGSK